MARRQTGLTFDDVRRIAAELPGVEDGMAWGVPAVNAIIADAPETYYLKPHYVGYASVLVRLSRIDREALKDLLHASWRFVDASASKRSIRRRATLPKRAAGT